MKKNRAISFLLITLIYLIATVIGVNVYKALELDMWLNLLISDIAATIVTFIFSLIFKNASVYDPYWSVQPIIIIIFFALCNTLNIIKFILIIVVCLWGVRLTANWAYTFHGLNKQDWRYTMLQEKTKKWYPLINFFGIHLFPTLVVYSCILPALYVLQSDINGNILSYIFISISYIAVLIQGIADCQMHFFKKIKNKENFNRLGLWKYSRHPNYLGEILMWWGVALSCVVTLQGNWYLILGAVINTLMFLIVSIPMADRRQSRKEAFEEYKNQTRMLLPVKKIFMKNNADLRG